MTTRSGGKKIHQDEQNTSDNAYHEYGIPPPNKKDDIELVVYDESSAVTKRKSTPCQREYEQGVSFTQLMQEDTQ